MNIQFVFSCEYVRNVTPLILQIGPCTLLKSQVIDTCVDFDNFYMVFYWNLERILLLYYVFKFEQTKTMVASDLQKTHFCSDFFLYIFHSLAKRDKNLYLHMG